MLYGLSVGSGPIPREIGRHFANTILVGRCLSGHTMKVLFPLTRESRCAHCADVMVSQTRRAFLVAVSTDGISTVALLSSRLYEPTFLQMVGNMTAIYLREK